MDAKINMPSSAIELQNNVSGYLDELIKRTDEASVSEEINRYLEFSSRFHQYSPSNVFLILLSRPNAARVAGYNQWLKLGRNVKKGEHAIVILAPLLHKELDVDGKETTHLRGFKSVRVFDVAQTEGLELPLPPDWKSPQKNVELQKKLIQFAKSKGIEVVVEELEGEIQGISMGKLIKLSPHAGTKTLIHEICHEILHRGENTLTHVERELQAEGVAFVVSRYFDIKGLNSPNYLSLKSISANQIMDHFDRIQNTAHQIIEYLIKSSN